MRHRPATHMRPHPAKRRKGVVEALKELGISPEIKPGKIIGQRIGGDPVDEREHFYKCRACGQEVDKRDLGQVFHHEMPGHTPLPAN